MGDLGSELLPARIGSKTLAVAARQFLQPRNDVGGASSFGILQRAAAKRREAGRKYGPASNKSPSCTLLAQAAPLPSGMANSNRSPDPPVSRIAAT